MWGIMAPLSLFSNSHLSLSSFPSCFWWLPSQSVKFWNWNPFRLRSFLCAIFIQKKNCVVKMKLFFIFIGKKTFNINCFNLFLLKKRNNLFLRARRSQKKQELRRGNSPYFHKSSEKKKLNMSNNFANADSLLYLQECINDLQEKFSLIFTTKNFFRTYPRFPVVTIVVQTCYRCDLISP